MFHLHELLSFLFLLHVSGRRLYRRMSRGVSSKTIIDREEDTGKVNRSKQNDADLQEIFNNAFDRDSDHQISSEEFVNTIWDGIRLHLD
eukprot:SAG31_NODE_2053_length_6551_cov_7.496125_1_plen_88_part_10